VRESELTASASQSLLRLVRTDTNEILLFSLSQPIQEGGQARRRLVISPTIVPAPDTPMRLTFEPDALVDLFLNKPSAAFDYTFGWPVGDLMIFDTVSPRVELILVRDGVLEIEFSEETDPALAAAEILVGGASNTWSLKADRYTLVATTPLPVGTHELRITSGAIDLAGSGLESVFVGEVTVDPAKPEIVVYENPDVRAIDQSAVDNVDGFHGFPWDSETGFAYVRHRYFDYELGRFITADPLGFIDGPSQYAAFGNDPYNFIDPSGTGPKSAAIVIDFVNKGLLNPRAAQYIKVLEPGPGHEAEVAVWNGNVEMRVSDKTFPLRREGTQLLILRHEVNHLDDFLDPTLVNAKVLMAKGSTHNNPYVKAALEVRAIRLALQNIPSNASNADIQNQRGQLELNERILKKWLNKPKMGGFDKEYKHELKRLMGQGLTEAAATPKAEGFIRQIKEAILKRFNIDPATL